MTSLLIRVTVIAVALSTALVTLSSYHKRSVRTAVEANDVKWRAVIEKSQEEHEDKTNEITQEFNNYDDTSVQHMFELLYPGTRSGCKDSGQLQPYTPFNSGHDILSSSADGFNTPREADQGVLHQEVIEYQTFMGYADYCTALRVLAELNECS